MKIGPFTPPDVRDAILERQKNPGFPLALVPEWRLELAGLQFCIEAHETVPPNFVEERFLAPFFVQAPARDPDFFVHARRLPSRPPIPLDKRPEEISRIGEDAWDLHSYVAHLRWAPASSDVFLEYHGTLLDAVEALRLFLALQLVRRGTGLILHAAAAIHGDRTYVFLGESGAGKSTSVAYTPGTLLCDEMAAIVWDAQGIGVHPTPFGGEHFPHARTGRDPVFFFVEKKPENARIALSPRNALTRLLSQTVMLRQAPMVFWQNTVELLGRLADGHPVEILEAAPGGTFWKELLT